ncbi:MAG: hypothetical protein OEY03_12760, partial [Rhizobacter sp.]|nr:hypothetical protein [Rhizobacter sp.]
MKPQIGLGRLLRNINRLALGAAVGILTLAIVISSFGLGLMSLTVASQIQARVLAENAAAALTFGDHG